MKNAKFTVKRRTAAEMLGGVSTRTMRRLEIFGALTPIKLNARVTLYRISEIENILSGKTAANSTSSAAQFPQRGRAGQFRTAV